MNNKAVKFLPNTRSDVTLINEQTRKKIGQRSLLKMVKIAHGITGNELKFVGECYSKYNIYGKDVKIQRIHYESNTYSIWIGLRHSTF